MRELLAIMLARRATTWRPRRAAPQAAAAPAGEGPVDMVITDVKLPDGDGIEILRHVKAAAPDDGGHRDDRLRVHRDGGGRARSSGPTTT